MGYTHYWYRKDKQIEPEIFERIASDFKKLLPKFNEFKIPLAGGDGEGDPIITREGICFNGCAHCEHPESYELGIAWPSKNAGGIANTWREDVRSADWFAGAMIDKRACSGNCSHEACYFPRAVPKDHYKYFGYHPTEENGKGWHFDFCKTAYKPYDLPVTCFLVLAKHHLLETLWVSSDGETQHWAEARILCQQVLGFGAEFELNR